MSTSHSPEIQVLLIACAVELSEAKKATLNQFLERNPINWDRLYTLAVRHKVAPFLYRTLQEIPATPESLLATLQNDCRTIATDNLLKLHQYKLLAKRFADHDIDHFPLKGIFLASSCYPDSSLRGIGDLDVLVAKDAVFKSVRLLKADDYHLDQKSTLYMQYDEKVMFSDLYEVSLFKPFFNNSGFDLDLHWEFICFNKQYKVFSLPEIRSRSALSIEYQIVLTVTHHGVTGIWQTISYVNDLYFLVNNRPIDWAWLLQEFRHYGLDQIFLVGLFWCQQIWELPLPPTIQEMLTAKRIQLLAEEYSKNWETSEAIASSKLILGQLTFFLKAQTQFSKRLKVLLTFGTSRIIRYSTFKIGKRTIYIPKQLGFITVFIRAIRSFLRFIPAFR
ncbi:nucleotidyltransferase family protein [Spirosoma foliorum]|uniref:Nucleotidyltransferase family protein n=1 Tax=Spirosoma foliorum TaxID=2710596 RepID=A0A7G5GRV4_9BACT|nr:nucleotidyltransferase family protein [Spirosoma foliorum]QMW01596.1 nucleotidyltransferase family protein [Spirosoma foliorum]